MARVENKMKTYLDCLPCFLRQALEASRMATNDQQKQREVLDKVMQELQGLELGGMKPPDIADRVHYMVRKITSDGDPYKKLKDEFNDRALFMYPDMKDKVEDSDDPLLTATKLAIAGNIIDFGPNSNFDLEGTVEDVLDQDFGIDHFDGFKKELDDAEEIVYLADNSGEIVFDKLLLERMEDKKVIFVVKGGPILNDAMLEDAEYVGIDQLAELETVSNGLPNTGPKRDSEEFKRWMKEKDMVISKGQGNYEALSDSDLNIFFLLKAKCPVIADDLGVKVGDIVLV